MTRDIFHDALILFAKEEVRDNLSVIMLTQDDGVKRATLFGGRKSRLRALVSPWHTGKIWLYEQNPGNAKITDFDAQKYRHSFRENLGKAGAASVASELVIKTKGAGGSKKCWILANGFLDGLDICGDDDILPGLMRFLWRYLDLLGVQPALDFCACCGEPLADSAVIAFDSKENGFMCADCARYSTGSPAGADGIELMDETADYLRAVSALESRESRKLPLSAEAAACLKTALFYLICEAAGERLKTLDFC
ncbi:MAG: DNA repair protein RecO C-terminal domain-containing protein [Treponemataceae bacterium]|nr:MAG: DNA repair protein RecO C-terminal domain-containing protein [Treponemataceae bacterium]